MISLSPSSVHNDIFSLHARQVIGRFVEKHSAAPVFPPVETYSTASTSPPDINIQKLVNETGRSLSVTATASDDPVGILGAGTCFFVIMRARC
jgi:hypothetical protein